MEKDISSALPVLACSHPSRKCHGRHQTVSQAPAPYTATAARHHCGAPTRGSRWRLWARLSRLPVWGWGSGWRRWALSVLVVRELPPPRYPRRTPCRYSTPPSQRGRLVTRAIRVLNVKTNIHKQRTPSKAGCTRSVSELGFQIRNNWLVQNIQQGAHHCYFTIQIK